VTVTTPTVSRSEPRQALATLSASVWLLSVLGVMLAGGIVGFLTGNFLFVYTIIGLTLATGFAVSAFLPSDPTTRPIGKTARQGTDVSVIVALIAACLVLPFVAIPFGHIARRQIIREGGRGDGMALAALIIGYAEVFVVIATSLWFWNFLEQLAAK
jgi:hypothetical protein